MVKTLYHGAGREQHQHRCEGRKWAGSAKQTMYHRDDSAASRVSRMMDQDCDGLDAAPKRRSGGRGGGLVKDRAQGRDEAEN